MKKIKIEEIQQKSKTDCGIASALILTKHAKIDTKYEYIAKKIKRNKERKVNIFDIAEIIKRSGGKPKVFISIPLGEASTSESIK